MSETFLEYQHIERVGSDEVEGILEGTCYVFPKIDGTNASVWYDTGQVCAGSRRRQLSEDADNAGFMAWVNAKRQTFEALFSAHPAWRIYGEWLVPHTLKTYREAAWRKFYVFDVWDDDAADYLQHYVYAAELGLLEIPCIPPLEIVTNPNIEHLTGLLDRNTYLIADGSGPGEGLVIKNYAYRNKYGRRTWAKIVRNEFKERNRDAFGIPTVDMSNFEQELATEYVTRGRVAKTLEKMRETGDVTSRRIPELLGRVWNDIIVEETWEILREHKNPTIDFKALNRAVIATTKRNCPELFGEVPV